MSTLIVPDAVPHVFEDCEQLRKAFAGCLTIKGMIISILGHRNAEQRKLIRQTYAEAYGEDLLKELDKELSNDFEENNPIRIWRRIVEIFKERRKVKELQSLSKHIRIMMNRGMGSIREVAVEAGMDMIVISPDHHRHHGRNEEQHGQRGRPNGSASPPQHSPNNRSQSPRRYIIGLRVLINAMVLKASLSE